MDSFVLRSVRAQVEAVLAEIERLKGSEFPYLHSEEALNELYDLFSNHLSNLSYESKDQPTVDLACNAAFASVRDSLDILGFILRSTNVRNAFEVYGPLLRLARKILGSETKLLISSEWYFSPFTYIGYQALPGFVLIGLPATESSNPFLVPLAGHELGHSVWNEFHYGARIRQSIEDKILDEINKRWSEYSAIHPEYMDKQSDLNADFWMQQTWKPAWAWAMRQSEELFCDFIGLRIFGEAYLYAFAYLLAPWKKGERQCDYPNMLARANALAEAAKAYGLKPPEDYIRMFQDLDEPQEVQKQTRFLLSIADSARKEVCNDLASKANEVVTTHGIPHRNVDEVNRCNKAFNLMVPVQHTSQSIEGLANILNAAWKAWETSDFFGVREYDERKQANLKELVLKSIEVFEIESKIAKRNDPKCQ